MLFNSAHFLIFFPIVVAAYFSLPHRLRWILLLASSCYFYMVFIPKYILILFALILIDYTAGIAIEGAQGTRRRVILAVSLVANVGMLGFYKYFNFFSANLNALFAGLHWNAAIPALEIILPIGLSFHTFQAMAYTIEVYRGTCKAERHLGIYAVYVLFFPQLVAGPIERPQLLGQFHVVREFDYRRVADGLKLMLWGLIKKVVIADRLTVLVDHVYANPGAHNGSELALATYFFSFQIYCDFSGYTDIALGAAQVLGIHLMQNFNRPYFSKSVSEFWKRWHISLSSWFRDYLYLPLGGSRVPPWRRAANLIVVFLVSGLWHGANWTFLLWGAMHGAYLIASLWTEDIRARLARLARLDAVPSAHKFLSVLVTFHLVTLAWIAFRARSVSEAFLIMRRIFELPSWRWPENIGMSASDLAIALAAIVFLESVHLLQRRHGLRAFLSARPGWVRWPAYAAMVVLVLLLGKFKAQSFIYFQF